MATTLLTGKKSWKELANWYQRFPFGDSEPYPYKITPDTAHSCPGAPMQTVFIALQIRSTFPEGDDYRRILSCSGRLL